MIELAEWRDRPPTSWKTWVLVLVLILLSVLLHVLLMLPRFPWSTFSAAPPRVAVEQVDPKKLEAIRRQWKNQPQQLLLDKNKSIPTAEDAPKDARYMSDRNIRVEKEQRAKETATLPHPHQRAAPTHPTEPQTPPKAPDHFQNLPRLDQLGVPMKFTPKSQPEPAAATTPGGDQWVDDRKLPEGSENLLNAQESIYYSFYARIYEAVAPIWQSRVSGLRPTRQMSMGDYVTGVDVVFDREGNLVAVNQLQSSGIPEFDHAAEECWKAIQRFPNPPSGLLNGQGEVHVGWTFIVRLGQGSYLQYMPPERAY